MREYDLVVIGSGPGGQKAAIAAAKLGKSVAVIRRIASTVPVPHFCPLSSRLSAAGTAQW
jgi:succinate dehydrogenase/fumarate reductase flavoprotein subunit